MSSQEVTVEYREACRYCSHLGQEGTHLFVLICMNPASPYYDQKLPIWQRLIGCEEILYDGKKVPSHVYRLLPADSCLRQMPVEQVVDGDLEEAKGGISFPTDKLLETYFFMAMEQINAIKSMPGKTKDERVINYLRQELEKLTG